MEASRNQAYLKATGVKFIHKFLGSFVEMNTSIDLIKYTLWQSLEGRYTLI